MRGARRPSRRGAPAAAVSSPISLSSRAPLFSLVSASFCALTSPFSLVSLLRSQFGNTKPKPLNRSQLFVPADEVAQEEATEEQLSHLMAHAQGPYGVYPNDTWVAKLDYVTTSSRVAPNNIADDPSSLASRIAHRRVARTKRNLNGGLFRPDPYDDSTVDDIAALDPRLKILQSRTEYRSGSSAQMQTSSEELFDMRDDGAVYGGGEAQR
jgi:hypothetical protein